MTHQTTTTIATHTHTHTQSPELRERKRERVKDTKEGRKEGKKKKKKTTTDEGRFRSMEAFVCLRLFGRGRIRIAIHKRMIIITKKKDFSHTQIRPNAIRKRDRANQSQNRKKKRTTMAVLRCWLSTPLPVGLGVRDTQIVLFFFLFLVLLVLVFLLPSVRSRNAASRNAFDRVSARFHRFFFLFMESTRYYCVWIDCTWSLVCNWTICWIGSLIWPIRFENIKSWNKLNKVPMLL